MLAQRHAFSSLHIGICTRWLEIRKGNCIIVITQTVGARAAHGRASGLLPTFKESYWSFHLGRAQVFICRYSSRLACEPFTLGGDQLPPGISSPPGETIINIKQVNVNTHGGKISLSSPVPGPPARCNVHCFSLDRRRFLSAPYNLLILNHVFRSGVGMDGLRPGSMAHGLTMGRPDTSMAGESCHLEFHNNY